MKCAVRILKKDWEPNTIDFSFGKFEKNTVVLRRNDALPNFTFSSSLNPKFEGSHNPHPPHSPIPCVKRPATRRRIPQEMESLALTKALQHHYWDSTAPCFGKNSLRPSFDWVLAGLEWRGGEGNTANVEVSVFEAAVFGFKHHKRRERIEVEEFGGLESTATEKDHGEWRQV